MFLWGFLSVIVLSLCQENRLVRRAQHVLCFATKKLTRMDKIMRKVRRQIGLLSHGKGHRMERGCMIITSMHDVKHKIKKLPWHFLHQRLWRSCLHHIYIFPFHKVYIFTQWPNPFLLVRIYKSLKLWLQWNYFSNLQLNPCNEKDRNFKTFMILSHQMIWYMKNI